MKFIKLTLAHGYEKEAHIRININNIVAYLPHITQTEELSNIVTNVPILSDDFQLLIVKETCIEVDMKIRVAKNIPESSYVMD